MIHTVRQGIVTLDTATLRAELSRALTITAHGLAYLAAVWAEPERRGEDLSDLRVGLAQYLPAIAAGRIAAEAVATFAGQSTVLKRVARLSLDDQRRLAAGEPVPVVSASADGQYTERSLPLRVLTAPQVATVIDEFGRIRTPIEQRQHLRQTARPPRPVATPARTAEIRGAVAAISDDDLRALAASRRLAIVPMCAAEPCERPARTKGLCQRHYRRS